MNLVTPKSISRSRYDLERPDYAACSNAQIMAGAEGFEPPRPVLETGSLAVELTPLRKPVGSRQYAVGSENEPILSCPLPSADCLLDLFMNRMVPARRTELFQLQAVLILFLVLRRCVVTTFAVATL